MSQYAIKHVAVYLRKSRGDEEKDLEKHRLELLDLCSQNEWAYVEYAEVGTSDSIELRPKMKELMQDVEQGMYDAVVAIHIDRLSRGDAVDRATLTQLFARSETLLVTPSRVYDYNNDTDMLMAEFEGMMARMEYKQISRRFRQGKARNAKQGLWSNGVPPFPYYRNPDTGRAVPDQSKLPVYRWMIEKALSGWACTDIAWELNKMGTPSPKNTLWSPAVIRRLLVDEVHLGKIVVGKKRKATSGDLVTKARSEWIVYNNCHEAVKTQIEHDKILFIMNRQANTPVPSRSGKSAFSGLVICKKCGHTMQIQKRSNRPYDSLKSCTHRDHFGERCYNLGAHLDVLEKYVFAAVGDKEQELEEAIKSGLSSEDVTNLRNIASIKLAEIKDQERAIERIFDFFERGKYSEEQFDDRFGKADAVLKKLESEYQLIETQIQNSLNARNEDLLISVREVLKIAQEANNPKEVNRAYKSIISSIEWQKDEIDKPPMVSVNFL